MGTPRKTKKVGVEFEVHLGKKMEDQWKVAERILGRWRIAGTEPYKVCERDEDLMGNRNLLESRRKRRKTEAMSTFRLSHNSEVFLHTQLRVKTNSQAG